MGNKPPQGVIPYQLWLEGFDDDPTLGQWLARYMEVNAACERYHRSGMIRRARWLRELGVAQALEPHRTSRSDRGVA